MKTRENLMKAMLVMGIFAFTFVSIATIGVDALEKQDSLFEEGQELYYQGRSIYYSSEGNIKDALQVLNKSYGRFAELEDNDQKFFWQGQVQFLLGEIYEVLEDKRQAAQAFNQSGKLAEKALKANPRFSEGYRLLSDTYMRLMAYNGSLYATTKGPEAQKLLYKAIKLDKSNYTAYNSLGIYLINAPKIGGGDINKGINMLNKALDSDNEYDNFISYVWLSTGYQKKGNMNKALKNIEKAEDIYPNSRWAQGIKEQIQSKEGNS